MGKIIGIDFGSKKIGISVSDRDKIFALPKTVLLNDKDLMHNLEKIIKEEDIEEVVVGESLDYKGKENPVMKDIKKFIEEIKEKFYLKVNLEPEFLTTRQAKSIQCKSRMLDASAAALILQSFLDKKVSRNNF